MVALLSLVAAVLLGRYVRDLKTAGTAQALLYLLSSVVLVVTAPAHGSTRTTGLLLAVVLAPLTVLALFVGRVWRGRSNAVPSPVL